MASYPEKAAELKAALVAWWKDTGAGFPTKNPDFDEKSWWNTKGEKPEGKAKAKGKGKAGKK